MSYKVLSNLNHNGRLFEAGSEMPDGLINSETAAQLVADGILEDQDQAVDDQQVDNTDVVTQPDEKPAEAATEQPAVAEPTAQPSAEANAPEVPLEQPPSAAATSLPKSAATDNADPSQDPTIAEDSTSSTPA